MKSKKQIKEVYKEVEQDTKEECTWDDNGVCTCEDGCKCEPTPKKKKKRKMINRKAIQAEIDIDKDIKRLLATGYYNHNQIASMIRGANLERVKDVSRKT